MAIFLLLAFIAVPVIEIALFIQVGGLIGVWPTIGIVLLTAFLGTSLLRYQGFAVLQRAQESAARNELPIAEVFDGMCLLLAGVLLLTPGFFTDTLGFLLLVPPVRRWAGQALWRWLIRNGRVSVQGFGFRGGPGGGNAGPGGAGPGGSGSGGGGPGGGPVIDGDYEEVDPSPPDRDRLGRSEKSESKWGKRS